MMKKILTFSANVLWKYGIRIALGIGFPGLIATCQTSQPLPESPMVQPLVTPMVEGSPTVAATETPTNIPTKTQTATPTEVVRTEASQEEIEELSKNLYCPDIRGCIVRTIDGTSIVTVATGYLKEIRLKKSDGTEYGTAVTAQVITRVKDRDPNVIIPRSFWITVQAELDNDKGRNQDFIAIFFIKLRCLGIGINTPEMERAETLDFYKEWIQKGRPLSVTFKIDGKPYSGVYEGSQFSDPSLTKSIHDFLQSDGATEIDPDSVLAPYVSSDTPFSLNCGP